MFVMLGGFILAVIVFIVSNLVKHDKYFAFLHAVIAIVASMVVLCFISLNAKSNKAVIAINYVVNKEMTVRDITVKNNSIILSDKEKTTIDLGNDIVLVPYDREYIGILDVTAEFDKRHYIFNDNYTYILIPRANYQNYINANMNTAKEVPFKISDTIGKESEFMLDDLADTTVTDKTFDDDKYRIIEYKGKQYMVPSKDVVSVLNAIQSGSDIDMSSYAVVSEPVHIPEKTRKLRLSYRAFNVERNDSGVVIRSEEQPVVIVPISQVQFVAPKDDLDVLIKVYDNYEDDTVVSTDYVIYIDVSGTEG